jgi:hypothetical protein
VRDDKLFHGSAYSVAGLTALEFRSWEHQWWSISIISLSFDWLQIRLIPESRMLWLVIWSDGFKRGA